MVNALREMLARKTSGVGEMKYTEEQYINAGYFEVDDVTSNQNYKIVKVRKWHHCVGLETPEHIIEIGEQALRETAIVEDAGFQTCYVCLPCLDKWLNEINGED